ncbi:MAG: sigma-70 family RNA polymerase sigma factor [Dorea sp.]|nr:sigma-70 family RNA polymerase sigma factor [Dorea sp.]
MKCDAAAFARMYEVVYIDLYKFALCMMKQPQEAEDAVSEAVLTAYEKIGQLREEGAFKGWMLSILSNICKRKLKERAKVIPLNGEKEEDALNQLNDESRAHRDSNEGQSNQQDVGLSMDLKSALEHLTEEEQDIIVWSVFSGYNGNEIGKLLKLPPGTIRSKRSRAFAKMREYLQYSS